MTHIPHNARRFYLVFSFTLCALGVLYINDIPLLPNRTVQFSADTGDNLVGTYYQGSISAGILFLHGFSSEQTVMKNAINEFAAWGVHAFSFDFSGHGRSGGTLEFDNAATDVLARQVLTALDRFQALSGLNRSSILIFGHSMGARVALQAMTMTSNPVQGLILLGVSINLAPNFQASFFTGTNDTSLPWIQNLNRTNPATNIILVRGQWDDILPSISGQLLLERLLSGNGGGDFYQRNYYEAPAVFHNYEPLSIQILRVTKLWARSCLNLPLNLSIMARHTGVRFIGWGLFLVCMLLQLLWGKETVMKFSRTKSSNSPTFPPSLEITRIRRYLWGKGILWFGALPIFALLAGILGIIPIGLPVFNLIYVGFIASYGILQLLLYRIGKMPGTRGKILWFYHDKPLSLSRREIVIGLGTFALIFIEWSLFGLSGWWYEFPLNARALWLLIFTILTFFGFYIGSVEMILFQKQYSFTTPHFKLYRTILSLLGFIPFFLLVVFYLILGSYSGMLGGLQGLIILGYIFLIGQFLHPIVHHPILIALGQAFLLQWLVLSQSALFFLF